MGKNWDNCNSITNKIYLIKETKTAFDWLKTKESELEDMSVQTFQSEIQREKRVEKIGNNLRTMEQL